MAISALGTTGGGVPGWVEAGLWGLLGGGALVLGALIAWFVRVPPTVIASVMAFGSGVLISAGALDLMQGAAHTGGPGPTGLGLPPRARADPAAHAPRGRG